jgi:ketosteroid isomerase-like protein
MSQENVEALRRGYEHFAQTGEPIWDEMSPQLLIRDLQSPDQAEYVGHDGFRHWLADWSSAWEEWHIEVEEILDAGDAVVVLLHHTARGHSSGLNLDSHDGIVYTFRDGVIAELDYYTGRERALEAAGLA